MAAALQTERAREGEGDQEDTGPPGFFGGPEHPRTIFKGQALKLFQISTSENSWAKGPGLAQL